MKIKILAILLGTIIIFQGCSHKVQTIAVASSDQKTYYDGSLTSQKKYIITLSYYNNIILAKERTIFKIILQNRSETPVKFSNDNILVTFEGNGKDRSSKKLNTQTGDAFLKYLEDVYYTEEIRIISSDMRKVGSLVDFASPGMMDKQVDRSTQVQIEMLGPKLTSSVNKITDMRKDIEQLKETIPEIVIKPTTILPSDTYTGIVVCDTNEMTPEIEGTFKIVVSIEGESHEFTFERKA